MKHAFIVLFSIVTFLFLQNTATLSIHAASNLEKGAIAPDFRLSTLDGKTLSLSDFRGQTVILNFWASWCPPCKEEMPAIEQFYQKNKQNNITVLSVNLTSQDSGRQKLQQFVEDHSLSFPVLLDEKGEVGKLYQILTIPTSFIIDPTGKITTFLIGPLDEAKMTELIRKAHRN